MTHDYDDGIRVTRELPDQVRVDLGHLTDRDSVTAIAERVSVDTMNLGFERWSVRLTSECRRAAVMVTVEMPRHLEQRMSVPFILAAMLGRVSVLDGAGEDRLRALAGIGWTERLVRDVRTTRALLGDALPEYMKAAGL